MLTKHFKILIFLLILFYPSSLYSKNTDNNDFNSKNLFNYFSALISYDNQKNTEALKFFNSSKYLINRHEPYLKKYITSLVIEGKVNRAIQELKYFIDKKNADFFEAYLLLALDSIVKKDFKKSTKYLSKLSNFKDNSVMELIIYQSLKDYIFLFKNKEISPHKNSFKNLSSISKTFQNCYLNKKETQLYFENLINNEIDYSRYKFFYINYLIEKNNFNKVKEISNQIDSLSSSLLISQTKNWIDKKKFEEFNQIFSCQNEKDILGEFLFLISSLYSNEDEIEESNFYLNISNYLNPKFKFNLSLLVENYFIKENYRQSKKILNYFNKNDDVYYWYKIKKKSQIISIEAGDQESSNFIKVKFKKIKTPTVKTLFEMANITKGFKDYKTAIHYYTEVLSKINENTQSYGDILYRRGGSYERLGKFKESDEDLLKSLEINSDDAYVLNYLAYSWLERDYKIDIAIEMLEKAYRQKENDPFILDSVGWAYYLVDDLIKAEKFMNRAIEIMPNDPIVNDHYGDILWRLDRKIQARYYWKNVLNLEDTKEKMKEDINVKLLKGPKKI